MIYRYSSIAIMTLLASASSFAASAVLPPLPSQQPPPVVQDSAKPPPPVSLPTAEPIPLAPPAAKKQNPSESLPPPAQAPMPSAASVVPATSPAPAPIQVSPSDAKKTSDSPKDAQEESESFIDTGQKHLPRIQRGDESADSGSYNPSDLRIPVIESAEKDAAKNSEQSNPQVSDAASAPAADAMQAVPAAHVAPDISLPEAAHTAQATDTAAAVAPAVSAQTLPQAPASEVVTAAPVVSAPPPPMPASTADAAPVLVPAPVPPLVFVPAPPPPPPPVPVVDVPKPHAAAPSSAEQLTADQIKFIDDEAIVFTLADDDVELGEITEAAKISQMPAYNYIKLFWKNYKTPLDKMQKKDVDLFLAMLETYPSGDYAGAMNYYEASDQAFDAASDGKLSDLRAIISHYPVLQMRDARGNNMLESAIEADRLEIARFLLIRGIDLYATNYEGYDAFAIAGDENNDEAADLLSRARFVGRR